MNFLKAFFQNQNSKNTPLPNSLLPALLMVLGLALRIVGFGIVPGGYQMDEAYSAWNAYSLYHTGIDSSGHSFPVYFEAWGHGMNALNSYLMLPFLALCGGHVNLLVVRLPQLVVSLLTLPAVYVSVRKLSNETLANWTLFFIAICPWHMMMSRWGLESNLVVGFLAFGFFFFVCSFERPYFLLFSAICYGLSLYCYAVIWPVLPLVLLLQGAYCIRHKKVRVTRWLWISLAILALLALPLVAFLLVNNNLLPEFSIGPFSIYKMTLYRGNELANSLSSLYANLRNMLYFFYHQDVGRPYDVIMPYGLFYVTGRLLIAFGIVFLLISVVRSLRKKEFFGGFLLLGWLIGAFVIGLIISVGMTQINMAYLPLLVCEALGVIGISNCIKKMAKKKAQVFSRAYSCIIVLIFSVQLVGFVSSYFGDYRTLTDAYFQKGTNAAVKYILAVASDSPTDVYINDGLKYPNVCLAAEIDAAEYLSSVVYSEHLPAPSSYRKGNVTFHMDFSLDEISTENIYLLYYTEVDYFADGFTLTQFEDWYVAVPNEIAKSNLEKQE